MRGSRPVFLCLLLFASGCGPEPPNNDGSSEATGGDSGGSSTGTATTGGTSTTTTAGPTSAGCSTACDETGEPTGSTGEPEPVCGDGQIDPGEACDDGNADPGDGCEPDCTPSPGVPFSREFPGVMPRAVAVAPGGWIVVGGTRTAPSIAPWLARLSGGGDEVWAQSPSDANVGSSVLALAVDAGGTIHAAGGTTYDDVSGEAWIARFDEAGTLGDAASFSLGDYTRAQGVALGPTPHWYVGGEAGTYSAWVRRLDAAATVEWTWQEPDASAFALAVDDAGNAFAAGVEYGAGGAVWKIDAAGQTAWKRPQSTPWLELAVDPSGAVHVGGSDDSGPDLVLWVAKLGPDGDQLWRNEFAVIAGASASDSAGGLALSSDGTLFFATQALWQGSQLHGFAAADGTPIWSATEPAWRWEGVAVLPAGDPIVVGWDVAGPDATGIVRVYDVP